MYAMPVAIPVTMPDTEPIETTEGLLLVHLPPAVVSCSREVLPAQTLKDPVMPAGKGFTVSVLVVVHPEASV
jgi:hypothetical protein